MKKRKRIPVRLLFQLLSFTALLLTVVSCGKKPADDRLKISFEKYTMPNGLEVVLHEDHSDPVISYAIMYHVGSSREVPGRTGFAHLFEHLLFSGSENVPSGEFDKIIESMGGNNNGFTSEDVTTYYEIFPKNALEKVLWLESDRMGFFINSITPRLMAIQQNVVQNEKRQSVDNEPYGFTLDVISKNLYPKGHPYSWTVIGEMEDLKNASLDDVKQFYENFYGPNNATLVLAGDFRSDSVKNMITKYFGEIKSHGESTQRSSMVPTLEKPVRVYHEDNFANVPELTMVWPVVPQYNDDAYALDFLARLLASGKKSPMYKVLIKEKKLTSATDLSNYSSELAGMFFLSIRANEGIGLNEIEKGINEAFARFENDGITDRDVERVRAMIERSFYNNITSVYNKSLQLAFYNTFLNDPGYIEKDIEKIKAVTREDIMRVYEKYIKGKPVVLTSFVPKGRTDMAAENSVPAKVTEEDITKATQVEIAELSDREIQKTPSSFDRTAEPPAGPDPEVKVPEVWSADLSNGIKVYGITNEELPLVEMRLVFDGGIRQDSLGLPGVASMVARVLPQGTRNRTPEELEEEIELLGSRISVSAGREEMSMNAGALSRNFGKTVSLMKEIILEPRWDSSEFAIAQRSTRNSILQGEANPQNVGYQLFNRILYGDKNIYGYNSLGTKVSIDRINIDNLKQWYDSNISPSNASFYVAGNVTKEEVLEALEPFEKEWKEHKVAIKSYPVKPQPGKPELYFYDMKGSRQSVIYIGYLALSRDNPDYPKADFINYRLGGAFTSILNQILREQKGYTYGASSGFAEMKSEAPFIASTMVRSDATLESLKIFVEEMNKYRQGISEEDLQFIKNSMIRSNATRFETNSALTGMLYTMGKYGFPPDFIKKEEEIIKNMTVEDHYQVVQKYIDPQKMYFIVVGDAATQLKQLEKVGIGKPELVDKKILDM
ncbi:MAG TPA: pitrilysin family protein [Bacteroidales bacterium]|nr:pitrilysin family protein [Bacteroidales bacterium]